MIQRRRILDLIRYRPYLIGKAVGFDKLTELHNSWIVSMVFGREDQTLQAHRGSYKTTCVSVALSLIMILYPNRKILFMRKTDNDVKEVVEQVKKILLHPFIREIVRLLWGVELVLVRANSTELITNLTDDPRGTSQLVGMGIGTSLTGKHFDIIFTDDIVNVKDRVSRAEREHTKLIYQELQNIKNRGGRIYNTGTPWHKEDCFSLMPNAGKWDCYSTGLMTEEEIGYVRDHMLGSLFSANYELKHRAAEDVIFRDPRIGAEPELAFNGIAQIDAAYHGEDYTALTIIKKTDGKYYVFGKMWRKHVEDVEYEIIKYRKKFLAGKIYCETNADKGYLAKDLRTLGERVVSYPETMNKFLKISSYLRDEWENVYFVSGTDKEYIEQICEYNEEAEHDDAPDSLASAVRVLWNKKSDYISAWNAF